MNEDTKRAYIILEEMKNLQVELRGLQKKECKVLERDYVFSSTKGDVNLKELFGDKDDLIIIHNMGANCPYCTTYADGINGILEHLESRSAVVLLSPDDVSAQRDFAFSRGWKFNIISSYHHGEAFTKDMGFCEPEDGPESVYPGFTCFHREGDEVSRTGFHHFDPGDEYCVLFPMMELLKEGVGDWAPKYKY